MPCIAVTTNVSVSGAAEETLKTAFGQDIICIPRKSEQWLMCAFHENVRLWFQGTKEPAAYVEVSLFGAVEAEPCRLLTEAITRCLEDVLNISPSRVYIRYAMTPLWGWNGKNL